MAGSRKINLSDPLLLYFERTGSNLRGTGLDFQIKTER